MDVKALVFLTPSSPDALQGSDESELLSLQCQGEGLL